MKNHRYVRIRLRASVLRPARIRGRRLSWSQGRCARYSSAQPHRHFSLRPELAEALPAVNAKKLPGDSSGGARQQACLGRL